MKEEGYCLKCKGAEITTDVEFVCEDCFESRKIQGK